MMLLPMLTLSQTPSEPLIAIRDTLPDGRVFYIDVVNDPDKGELMRFDPIARKQIRIINEDRIAAKKENELLKADIADCELENNNLVKSVNAITIQKQSVEKQYEAEQEKNDNNVIVMKDYRKKAVTGKIMTVVGGVGIAVGLGGLLYAVLITQLN